MPLWLVSKYFYREMNPLLRYAAIPFLLLFNISVLIALLAALDVAGIWVMPIPRIEAFLGQLGFAGTAAYLLLVGNVLVGGLLLLIGIPLYLIIRDVKQTLDRFGILETNLTVDPEEPYVNAALDVFERHPETAIFCYGHTHRPKVKAIDDRLLVNTGTWLKHLHRRDVIAGRLPPVYYPSYQLAVVRISADADGITVAFEPIQKPSPIKEDLTLTERLLTLGREPSPTLPGTYYLPNTRE